MPRKKDKYLAEVVVIGGMLLAGLLTLFLSLPAKADYVYEGSQSLYDLQTNSSGSTGLGSNDDSVSAAFDLGFTFTFYGNDYTKARMATNGCLHFNLTGSYCGDYTPDPLPQYTNTLFPFWTDLIKDGGSAMKAKAFDDYTIFGWYKMREYNRANSDNSIEVWLYPNNTYEYRYGELDIIQHDVLIGEQGSTSQIYTYHFFDECNTGTTNVSGTCVSYDWNSSSNAKNTLLENGGSLFGDGTDQSLCATVPLTSSNCSGYAVAYLAQQCALNSLYDEDCSGYAAAYLTQQCNITQLYSQECPSYWSAYDDQQCEDDPQYSPSCAGYTTEASVAYYVQDEVDYGYEDPYMDNCINNPDYCYDNDPYVNMYFTDAEWYEIDLQEFGQTQVDEWYGTEVIFDNEGWIEWDTSPLDTWDELDYQMDIFDYEETNSYEGEYTEVFGAEELIELYEFDTILREELDYEEEIFIESFETVAELDEWFEEEVEELIQEERLAEEEPEEEFEEEIFEEEVVEEIFEEIEEERIAEAEEEIIEQEEELEEELLADEEGESKSSLTREVALRVVANTLRTATNSVSGSTGSASRYSSGGTVSSNNSGVSSAMTSSSTGGMSTSSSPSRSAQFASAAVQTQQVLSLSGDTGAVTNVSVMVTPMLGFDDSPQIVMADVQVQDMQGEIDTAIGGVMTTSEADQIADKIIAQNIKEQQEEGTAQQEATGEYGDESTLIAYLGYVPGFDSYKEVQIPPQPIWYKSKEIYADAFISDNINAFYGLARTNLNTMNALISSQPNL